MTPVRQRMTDAMVLRGLAERTQASYLMAVGQMARRLQCSPDRLSDEQVQAYLLHLLKELGKSRSTVNVTACAVRFLFCEVLGQTERRPQIPLGISPQRLPEVLSRGEVAALLGAPMSLPARTFLMTAYATGLRLGELCGMRGSDIDSAPDRMCIRVVQGKGGQDRYALLTPDLLEQLRSYWRCCRSSAQRSDWLFVAARDRSWCLPPGCAQGYYYRARAAAGIRWPCRPPIHKRAKMLPPFSSASPASRSPARIAGWGTGRPSNCCRPPAATNPTLAFIAEGRRDPTRPQH